MLNNNTYSHLLIFDGECLLCNQSVLFLLSIDKNNLFTFCTLAYAYKNNIISNDSLLPDSVVYIKGATIYTESNAIIQIANALGWPYSIMKFFYIIPSFIRDRIYRLIARNRYKIWGKTSNCQLIDTTNRNRILS